MEEEEEEEEKSCENDDEGWRFLDRSKLGRGEASLVASSVIVPVELSGGFGGLDGFDLCMTRFVGRR